MKRVLFLIHDLGPGGAEKVLVNLVNSLDRDRFDVSLKVLFDWGENRRFVQPHVHYSAWAPMNIRGNSHWMKLWTPEQLYRMIVGESYDIVVSFLEGPTARVAGGCPWNDTKVVSWIHTPILTEEKFIEGFRSRQEAERCYGRADELVFISADVRDAFFQRFQPKNRAEILYNIYDGNAIREAAAILPDDPPMDPEKMNWCGVGKLIPLKGWTRMLEIQRDLVRANYPAHFYLIGDGPQRSELEHLVRNLGIGEHVTFTGYRVNPYQYISRCMLYVCASLREGFSTAAVEALMTGTPVCAVNVGGMREILGEHDEYGLVTDNDDNALKEGVFRFFREPAFREEYARRAQERGQMFDKKSGVQAVERMLLSL